MARWTPGDTVQLPGLTFVGPPASSLPMELQVDEAIRTEDWLARSIDVDRIGREADLVRLSCVASSAQLAHDICLELSSSYLNLRNELQVSEAASAREFLADATQRIKTQLTGAEDSLAAFATRHGGVALDTRAEEEVRNLTDLVAQRDAKQAERAALREFLAGIEAGGTSSTRYRELASFPVFLENEAITELVASLIALDNRRSDLSVLRTEANPELVAVNQRIASIEQQLRSSVTAYERALTSQIQSLSGILATAERRIAGIPATQVELVRRERQVAQLETISGTLEGRLREAQLAEGIVSSSVRPIDTPQIPLDPSSPAVGLILALGVSLGLALGVLFAALREITDVRLRDRAEIEGVSGLRVIGMLPSVSTPGPLFGDAGSSSGRGLLRSSKVYGGDRYRSPAVESFRTLVADIKLSLAAANGGGSPKSIAVVSSAQGEGKTYTTCNLGLVWASTGMNILLVDADLRLGRIASFFGLPKDAAGLADVLRGEEDPSRAYQRIPAGGDNVLNVLTAGRAREQDVDTFHLPDRIEEAMRFFESRFDLVLVDTPPLNAVSDSTILAASVGAVLFVVRSGHTRPDALELALQRLQRTNRNLLGLVMNDVSLPSYQMAYYDATQSA